MKLTLEHQTQICEYCTHQVNCPFTQPIINCKMYQKGELSWTDYVDAEASIAASKQA